MREGSMNDLVNESSSSCSLTDPVSKSNRALRWVFIQETTKPSHKLLEAMFLSPLSSKYKRLRSKGNCGSNELHMLFLFCLLPQNFLTLTHKGSTRHDTLKRAFIVDNFLCIAHRKNSQNVVPQSTPQNPRGLLCIADIWCWFRAYEPTPLSSDLFSFA